MAKYCPNCGKSVKESTKFCSSCGTSLSSAAELSEKIIVSGSDMNVKDAGMENTYRGAEVSIPADSEAQTATLTFTYNGEGGVFRNNIIFKVIGEPEITFPDVTEDGKCWDVNYSISRVDMIAGVGGQERLRFVITNATEEPKSSCCLTALSWAL
jgi:hypothetical protein